MYRTSSSSFFLLPHLQYILVLTHTRVCTPSSLPNHLPPGMEKKIEKSALACSCRLFADAAPRKREKRRKIQMKNYFPSFLSSIPFPLPSTPPCLPFWMLSRSSSPPSLFFRSSVFFLLIGDRPSLPRKPRKKRREEEGFDKWILFILYFLAFDRGMRRNAEMGDFFVEKKIKGKYSKGRI